MKLLLRNRTRRSSRKAATPAWSAAACPTRRTTQIVLSLAAHEQRARGRSRQQRDDREAGCILAAVQHAAAEQRSASSRCRSRPKAPARSAAISPPMPAAPPCCATAMRAIWCWARSRARRRTRAERSARWERQYRLRPEAFVHRRRRHARHHHRRGAEALSEAAAPCTALVAVPDPAASVALLATIQAAMGDRLTGFELMSRVALITSSNIFRRRSTILGTTHGRCSSSSHDEKDAPLEEALSSALEAAFENGQALDTVIASSEAQSQALWDIRENIPESEKCRRPSVNTISRCRFRGLPNFFSAAISRSPRNFRRHK